MTSYLLTFTVYTTAMVGVIFLALFAYKKFSVQNNRVSDSNFLEVEDCVTIGVRKQLYVVRAGEEKFLIASDAERTTFLSKLNSETVEKPLKSSSPSLPASLNREPDATALSNTPLRIFAHVPYRENSSDSKEISSYEAIGHFYPVEERENVRKDATAILRNIVSTGERR